ncbi:MAG TPA: oxygen-independent coproporphyrinogen III oxidase [Alphaproteobacteria bacterium]
MAQTHMPDLTAAVPRYTSYPTAVQFHSGIGPETHRRWLAALPAADPVSIYVHVPFCRQLCHYCGCNTSIVAHYAPVAEFLDGLERELALLGEILPTRLRVGHIHFGGGTPTILTPADLLRVRALLDRHFAIEPDAEIAIEIDPRTLTQELTSALAAIGVTRASLGVQDFDPAVQRAINRIQPFELVEAAVAQLRRAGITALNFDLIYGLPLQSVASLCATIDRTAHLNPGRIALFGYAHVPWMKKHQRLLERYTLPDATLRRALAETAAQRLMDYGYVPVGLDHFARPDDSLARAARTGALRRNFQGYTTDRAETLLAFGPSGISRLPQGYVQSASSVRAWRNALAAGHLPTARGVELSPEDRLRADVIERLMCDLEVDLDAVARRHGCTAHAAFATELGALQAFARKGLIQMVGQGLRVTDAGRPFVRPIAAVFDTYLPKSAGRHSAAV